MVPKSNGDGRAYIAGWVIKLVAALMFTGSLAWAQWVTQTNYQQNADLVELRSDAQNISKQLDRIEAKVDRVIEARAQPQGVK